MRAIGSAIVTTEGPSGPAGFLALSTSHLTAEPPIMTVAVGQSTSALGDIRKSGAFAINYLASDAKHVLNRFVGRDAPKGAERFAGLDCSRLETGAPILPGTVGAMDCRLEEEVERYGTILLFGRILSVVQDGDARPLVHFGKSVLSI